MQQKSENKYINIIAIMAQEYISESPVD